MRIISGKHKGKKLKSFDGFDVRPTSDRAREALFSMLNFDIIGSDFLDLCAGTGAMGLEALSRGANSVTFVDNSQESIKICDYNLKSIKENGNIVKNDALSFLKTTNKKFDVIFFDPPYAYNGIEEILKVVYERNLLKENGKFIYEHKSDSPSKEIEGFSLYNTKKYGIAIFDFYNNKSMNKAVFAGTFDPVTIGHEKVIEKASKIFDKLYVSLGVNPEKHPIFSVELRLEMLKKVCEKYQNVEVLYHEGMLVDLMKEKGIVYTVRGVRNDTDYAYENKMHLFNKTLYPEIVTLFFPCDKEFSFISSTAVRNAVKNGEEISKYLSPEIIKIIEINKLK